MDDSRGRLCALQFVAISGTIFIAKVIAIWWGRGEAKRGNTHNSNFLWICVPKEGKHTVRLSGDATTVDAPELHELRNDVSKVGQKQEELQRSLEDVVKQLHHISEKLGCSQQPQSQSSTAPSKATEIRGVGLGVTLPVDLRGTRSWKHA